MRNNETKNEIDEIKKSEEKNTQKDLIYKANKYKYNFQQYETISDNILVIIFVKTKLIQMKMR